MTTVAIVYQQDDPGTTTLPMNSTSDDPDPVDTSPDRQPDVPTVITSTTPNTNSKQSGEHPRNLVTTVAVVHQQDDPGTTTLPMNNTSDDPLMRNPSEPRAATTKHITKKRGGTHRAKQTQKTSKSSEQDDDDPKCLVCVEFYHDSAPREKWIRCCICKGWAHELCTSFDLHSKDYMCDMCE